MPYSLRFLLLILLAAAFAADAQAQTKITLTGQVVDGANGQGLPYASLGVLGKPSGTVADGEGRFSLSVSDSLNKDSIRVALLGYKAYTTTVEALNRTLAGGGAKVALTPAPVQIQEVTVKPNQMTRKVVGNSGNGTTVTARFKVNRLGNQIGQGMRLKRPSFIEQVSFHIAQCTYDSLFYRVNIYQVVDGKPAQNLLPEPVYVRVRKEQIKDRFVADVSKYNILAKGDIVVALETVKDLGTGNLALTCTLMRGPLYHTQQNLGGWEKLGGVGIGIDATVLEVRSK